MTELQESSLNRVADFIRRYDIACITAYRDKFENATAKTLDDRPEELKERDKAAGTTDPSKFTPYKYTTAEKKRRNHELRAELLDLKYGVTSMRGNYIENFGTLSAKELGEDSCFVVNLHDDPLFYSRLFALSEYYNQDCFIFKSKDSDEAYNVGTNNGQYPGYAQKDSIGKLHFNIENEFLSRVGNKSFSFTKGDNHRHDNRRNDFETRKKERIGEAKAVFNCDVYEDYQVGAKMTIHSIATGVELGMKKLRETTSSKLRQYVESLQCLNEGFGDVDMTGWICIGEIKGGSPFGAGGDIYLMVDPQFEGMEDRNEFKRLHTKFNTKSDGSGMQTDSIPTYTLQRLQIYPDYQDTYFGEVFLGKRKGAEGEEQHKQFMPRLNHTGNGKVTLMHNSSEEIHDGVIRYTGKHNNYSNNSDVGCYFWGSAKAGSDPSGNSRFTYYCEVPEERIYDFQTNLERLTLQQAMSKYPYVAQNWNDGQAIVVTSFAVTPITKIRDNSNGKVYDGQWKELQLHEEAMTELTRREKRRNEKNAANIFKKGIGGYHGVKQFGIISAENPDSRPAPRAVNKRNTKSLSDELKSFHYVFVPQIGHFGGNNEKSYFIFNISLNELMYYAAYYEQTSFFFGQVLEDGRVLSQYYEKKDTTKPATEENPYVMKEETTDWVDASDEENYSIIGKNFKFTIPLKIFEGVDNCIAEWRDHPIRRGSGESYVDLSINGVGEVPFRCRKGIYEHVQRSLHLNN